MPAFKVFIMNDFFLASNKTVKNKLGITVSQITVKDLDIWSQHAEPVRKELKKNYSDENLESVIKRHKLPVLILCTMVIDRDAEALVDLISKDADQFIALFKDVIEVNKAYFDQEDGVKNKGASKVESTWFDSFQLLISKGHHHADILNYSFGAFVGYLKAAQRNEKNNLLSNANIIRMAHHADKKEFDKFTDEMKRN